MLDVTILSHSVREVMEGARFNPVRKAEFVTKRLNVYARGATFAISPQEWAKCTKKALKLEHFIGRECWIGVDLSSHDDQTAIALIFELEENERRDLLALFIDHFIPEESPAFFNEKIADQLIEWHRHKVLTCTPGPIVDYGAVQQRIEDYCDVFDVQAVVFDRAHSVQMASSLIKKGIKAGTIAANAVEMSEPTKDLVIRARHGRLRHDGNPVLAWNAQNTCLTPGDLWRPIKDRTAPHLKIDGFSAACHANVARLGRVNAKMPKEEPPFDPNKVVRTFS
jgi:phage terminase large subunit-like protein